MPVGEMCIKTLFQSSLISHAFRGELFFLLLLFPYVRSRREALIAGIGSTFILSFFISLTIVVCIAVMGIDATTRTYFSIFSVSDYLETTGVKIVLATIWILVFWGKVALGQFATTTALAELCGLKSAGCLILPVAIMLLIFSDVFYPNNTDLYDSITSTLPGLMAFIAYLVPGLLLVIALIRLKLGRLDTRR